MRVKVIFQFPDIVDPDGPEADVIVELLTSKTQGWADKFNASAVWVDDVEGEVPEELI